jgi:hypothetical protein
MAKQYVFAFYWAASTLTTAGMVGYTTPKNARELVFVIVCMLVTLTIYAYVMGVLSPYATPCAAKCTVVELILHFQPEDCPIVL